MSHELPPEDWDLRGLSSWAMSRFQVDLKQNQLRQMNIEEVKRLLIERAVQLLQEKNLDELAKFLDPHYAYRDLANWAHTKFNIQIPAEELAQLQPEEVADYILTKVREGYQQREASYPVEYVLDTVFQMAQVDGNLAAQQLAGWANQRYQLGWKPEEVSKKTGKELQEQLLEASRDWMLQGRLEREVESGLQAHGHDRVALRAWVLQHFGLQLDEDELAEASDLQRFVKQKVREQYRYELTQLERFVLLQILDATWKDHLYEMDHLRGAVGLRAFAEQDPRIVFKREGANNYQLMKRVVRERVTDLVFRAKLTGNVQMRNVYSQQQAEHAEADSALENAGTSEQQADLEAAAQAGGEGGVALSRHARRAAAARSKSDSASPNRPHFRERKKRRR